ncbi:hypothetical protein ACIA8E_12980 [Streptomyces sp. NPDC051664]|uniref:hypothetical protein n=1 Tax=Streptomyces sp. NPDC051664 TaxID=3365668 RepID=UPI00378D6E36
MARMSAAWLVSGHVDLPDTQQGSRDGPARRPLRAGSPALGAGIPVADGITRDHFGNRIPTPPNLGADQDR